MVENKDVSSLRILKPVLYNSVVVELDREKKHLEKRNKKVNLRKEYFKGDK